ncbi:tRNA(Met) cytidine acetyltransferase [Rheinheimera riviphila]|uniref:tRNA(Met) cytidine acetyltransferase TmcA n=1 Tax=Rheinheimera riviphila TaxID=1834037 RepID=A0A437R5W5_9GAMM|nr:tRNA(Met) cytidine acetyltransferase [Rheinheimera riviphila]
MRQQLAELQQQYRQRRWRLPLWLQIADSMECHWLSQTMAELLATQHEGAGFWLGECSADLPLPARTTQIKHKGQLLGLEADWIVINGLAGIDWDLFAASSGCLRAGGLWLLITTTPEQFALQPNPQAQRMLSYPLQAHDQASNFQQFWLSQQQDWWLYNNELGLHRQPNYHPHPANPKVPTFPAEESAAVAAGSAPAPFSTLEQQQAVAAILKVVSGHRRRPLLLTAHRGRGKSAALGIAAAQLQQQGKQKLIITAPNPAAAAVALQHATAYLAELQPNAPLALQFWPIDLLLQEKPTADLVLVDEAAAIPLPQLQQLTQQYSRLVFATTEHGYEGTGRSFSLKFQPYLQQHCPGWQQLRLHTPIRYTIDDPLEQQIFRSFLLACEQPTPVYNPSVPLVTKLHPASELLAQPALLANIFGLLSLAHYQTEVTDLWALLDNPQLQVMALYQDSTQEQTSASQLLGCAVISLEGLLPPQLATQVYQGERRVQGHLLAQSLAFHLATSELATLPLARVQRIVIHPAWQNSWLGQYLLKQVQQHCQQQSIAAIGSSFGATPTLLRFWTSQGFLPVKLSAQAEQASGEPSVLMIKACDNTLAPTIVQLHQQFAANLYLQLADSQRQLNPRLALQLCQPPATTVDALAKHQLALFVAGQRPYELVELLLLNWFNQCAHRLPVDETRLLVQKLWQKHSWAELTKQQSAYGKAQLINQIRQLLATFGLEQPPTSSPDRPSIDLQ